MKRNRKKKYRIREGSFLDFLITVGKPIGLMVLVAGGIFAWWIIFWTIQYC